MKPDSESPYFSKSTMFFLILDLTSSSLFWAREWVFITIAIEILIVIAALLCSGYLPFTLLYSFLAVAILGYSLYRHEAKRVKKLANMMELPSKHLL